MMLNSRNSLSLSFRGVKLILMMLLKVRGMLRNHKNDFSLTFWPAASLCCGGSGCCRLSAWRPAGKTARLGPWSVWAGRGQAGAWGCGTAGTGWRPAERTWRWCVPGTPGRMCVCNEASWDSGRCCWTGWSRWSTPGRGRCPPSTENGEETGGGLGTGWWLTPGRTGVWRGQGKGSAWERTQQVEFELETTLELGWTEDWIWGWSLDLRMETERRNSLVIQPGFDFHLGLMRPDREGSRASKRSSGSYDWSEWPEETVRRLTEMDCGNYHKGEEESMEVDLVRSQELGCRHLDESSGVCFHRDSWQQDRRMQEWFREIRRGWSSKQTNRWMFRL